MPSNVTSAASWAETLAQFLREEPGVEAVRIDAATRKDQVKPREGVRLLELYESQMLNKTYLNIEPKGRRKKKA